MMNFPLLIRYIDNNELKVVQSSDEIQKGRIFTIEYTNSRWGRKSVPSIQIEDENDE